MKLNCNFANFSLVIVIGLGMYVFNGYTGALVSSSSYNTELSSTRQCDNTDSLEDTEDGLAFDTIYKKGEVKVKGRVTGEWAIVREDTCSSNVLHEGYCNGFEDASTIVTCEKGCSGGKCNLVSCIDNDNGVKYGVASSTSGIMIDDADFLGAPPKTQNAKTYNDYCSGNTLNEYFCSEGFVKKTTKECENGCYNGKCNIVEASLAPQTKYCEEDKPDNSIFIKAGVRTKVGNDFWSSYTYDYCSGNTLVDYYCTYSKTMAAKQVVCSYGCSDGKCNYPPCTDPDSSNSKPSTVKTTVTGLREEDSFGIPPQSQIKSYTDECTGPTSIREYRCNSIGKVEVSEGFCNAKINYLCTNPNSNSNCFTGGSNYHPNCQNGACEDIVLESNCCG